MTTDQFKQLKDAFIWEKQRLQTFVDKASTDPVPDPTQNPMMKELNDAWVSYFQKMRITNDTVIAICDKATPDPLMPGSPPPLDEQSAKIQIQTYISDSDYQDVRSAIEKLLA